MRKQTILGALALLFAFTGCTNLKVVRDYANESAKMSAYTELTTRYRDTYRREQPYLDAVRVSGEKVTDEKRQAAYGDLINIHKALTLYMETLARLAGEDTFSLSKDVDKLAGTIKQAPELGIKAEHVDAYAKVVQVLARWATSSKQEHAVREMVEAGDPHIQKLLAGMETLVDLYRKTNENEKRDVLGVFEVELPFTTGTKDVLLNRLARAHMQGKIDEYDQADKKYSDAEKALVAMAEGHSKLRGGLHHLSHEDLKESLEQTAKDIKTIRESLIAGGE